MRKRADFLALRKARSTGAPAFLLAGRNREDGEPCARVGYTVTKKLGGAVVRNRIRRRLREAVRQAGAAFAPGWDYVFIARKAALDRPFPQLLDDVRRALLTLSEPPK